MIRRFAVAALLATAQLAGAQMLELQSQALTALREQVSQGVDEKVHLSPGGTVVEFYNQNLKHYFRTAEVAEVNAVLNGAAGPGWVRTGDDFPAWVASSLVSTSGVAVCRFYAPRPNSHFYTISASECAQVKKDPGWQYEGTSFYAVPAVAGTCTSEYMPIYRAYNNRFVFNDSNHRFTTNFAIYQQMIAQGWTAEGVVMCAPLPTTVNQQKTEQLIGGTWVISYRYGTTNYVDRLTFDGLYQSPTSGEIYATGTNQRGFVALGQYAPSISQWVAVSGYSNASAYPSDTYAMTVSGNAMTGCFYFVFYSSQPLGSCNPLVGSR